MSGRQRGMFPPGFLWGAATSSYQVEGAVDADGRGRSIWDTFAATPGHVVAGDTGAVAADHYHRYRDDVRLMAELGMRMYRFSVAWPRIQPTGSGPVNEQGLDFYRRLVDALLEAGITPNLSLYHWDLPQALQDAGGWPARETALRYADYAALVYEALHDRVPWWSTVNEPWCVALLGYAAGTHAPGVRDPVRRSGPSITCSWHTVGRSARCAPSTRRRASASCSTSRPSTRRCPSPTRSWSGACSWWTGTATGCGWSPCSTRAIRRTSPSWQVASEASRSRIGDLAAVSAPIDWMGINYYNDIYLGRHAGPDPVHPGVEEVAEVPVGTQRTDMGWSITPTGLRDLLVSLGREHPTLPPLLVTENGAAYDDPLRPDGSIDDVRRIAYLEQHLLAVSDAIADGADVRGYLVWSLLDNFEWAEGYAKRFGIIHVDFGTLRRTPRRSARWYGEVIASNRIRHPRRPDAFRTAGIAGRGRCRAHRS